MGVCYAMVIVVVESTVIAPICGRARGLGKHCYEGRGPEPSGGAPLGAKFPGRVNFFSPQKAGEACLSHACKKTEHTTLNKIR